MSLYFTVGFLYSFILLISTYTSPRRRNREHWAGILLVGTICWPIDLFVGNMRLADKN